jgi:hypothetical protein
MNKISILLINLLNITKTALNNNSLYFKNSMFNKYSVFIKSINFYKKIKLFYLLLTSLNLMFTLLIILYYSNVEWDIFTPLVLILGFLSKVTPVFIEELITTYYSEGL